ncbi:MAG: M23 family metallopeptidase [bacterium]|nr:M23 family metallopeptidase [bacterium]
MPKRRRFLLVIAFIILANIVLVLYLYNRMRSDSNTYIYRWLNDPAARATLLTEQAEPCPGAPFLLPSSGFVGLLWSDPAAPYTLFRRHSGIDIFGDGAPGSVPVVAAYDGWLTRLDDWFSTVIIRHNDPLNEGRIIWTYYTHMGSRDGTHSFIDDAFPPGTSEVFVEQGTLLGYQGEYAGSGAGIALHVHFSIVTSGEDGSFNNEAIIGNTLDPSPYFGLPLRFEDRPARPIRC